jgi:hypothetical protein
MYYVLCLESTDGESSAHQRKGHDYLRKKTR